MKGVGECITDNREGIGELERGRGRTEGFEENYANYAGEEDRSAPHPNPAHLVNKLLQNHRLHSSILRLPHQTSDPSSRLEAGWYEAEEDSELPFLAGSCVEGLEEGEEVEDAGFEAAVVQHTGGGGVGTEEVVGEAHEDGIGVLGERLETVGWCVLGGEVVGAGVGVVVQQHSREVADEPGREDGERQIVGPG